MIDPCYKLDWPSRIRTMLVVRPAGLGVVMKTVKANGCVKVANIK